MGIRKLTVFLFSFLLFISLSVPASADMGAYMDDVMDSLEGLAPKSYEGQERGYLVGGSASLRFDNSNDRPLVSFTPPSLKVGCGGIDLVMGGFSYLNFEYLVQKLQGILSAAPAFAFQIALKTLCESCADIVSSLENITDMINALNVDSCKASKAIGGWAGEQLGRAVGHLVNTGEEDSWFSSLADTINETTNNWKKYVQDHTGGFLDCVGAGADPEVCKKLGQVSFIPSLMRIAFSNMNDTDHFFENIFRGYYGDIFQNADENNTENIIKVQGDPGCIQQNSDPNILDAMVFGNYVMKTEPSGEFDNTYCVAVSDETLGLAYKVRQILDSLETNIRNGTAPSDDEINLIAVSRVPLYRLISLAVLVERLGGDTDNLLTENFKDLVQYPLAYDIAYNATLHASTVTKRLISATNANKASESPESAVWGERIVSEIEEDIRESSNRQQAAWKSFQVAFGDTLEKEMKWRSFIYQELARNKLLESYLFAKGLR